MNSAQLVENEFSSDKSEGGQFLTFILDNEEYGVEILRVQEIRGWSKVTPIPNSPHYLKGVINLRGAIVPIIDLRERFGMDSLEYGITTVVIVLRVENGDEERIMGLVVDAVSEVYTLNQSQCQAPPDMGGETGEKFVKALASVDDKMIILLDIDTFLNAEVSQTLN
jgi:purine-binding chemotaxis protein CheW